MNPSPPIDWNAIIAQIVAAALPYVVPLVTAVFTALSILVGIVLNRLRAKFAASEKVDTDTLLKSKAKQGVYLAEEASAQAVKATGTPMTGAQKGELATAFVVAAIPDTPPAQAPLAVQAQVGATLGVGASKDVGAKP
jgi:hypothetical protein